MTHGSSNDAHAYIRNLESQLIAKADDYSCFPDIPTVERDNTLSYPRKYELLKTKLGELHDMVDHEATLSSLGDALLNDGMSDDIYDRIILLNKHGKGHVEKVITRASDLAHCICRYGKDGTIQNECDLLSPFEVFILLCGTQIHDIGNMYGRDNHTISFMHDFERYAKESGITDASIIKCVSNIARVHGGKINNSADTVEAAKLRTNAIVREKPVRQRLLAAILRFSDELADDSSRARDVSRMPKFCKIFHAYSKALDSVVLENVMAGSTNFVKLCYFLSKDEAMQSYGKMVRGIDGVLRPSYVTLLREIIERTKKMERERRYCSRFLRPHINIEQVKVEIEIDMGGFFADERIVYTLTETGYPGEDDVIPIEVEDSINSFENRYAQAEVPSE